MAWRNRYRRYSGRARSYGGRARWWASRNKSGLGLGGSFLAGAAIGMTDFDKNIPYEIKILVASLPSGVTRMIPGSGALVQLCRGMLVGDIVQARTGVNLAGGLGGSSGFQGV